MIAFVFQIIQLGHGELHDFVLSRSTVMRQSIKGEKKAAEEFKQKFERKLQEGKNLILIQWDGKKVEYKKWCSPTFKVASFNIGNEIHHLEA